MKTADRPLIVGAGPVGLAAALFLAREGIGTRLVDMSTEPSRLSKALAVNPRTLQILEAAGVTERMLAIGLKLRGACLWHGSRLAGKIEFHRLQNKFPFMLALSQAVTERLLAEALVELGGTVERGARLVDCANEASGVTATLDTPQGLADCRAPWMLAADGAHSTARERLGIEFPGSTFRNKWYLADVALDVSLPEDHVHIFFLSKGEFQFMIRVIDPQRASTAAGPLWRVVGNRAGLLDRLATGRFVAPPLWTSDFTVSHRINRQLAAGQIYFAGDAAHIHSPVGARGMNLGIEDAWVFSQLAARGDLSRYQQLRRPIDRRVVRLVSAVSRVASCEPTILGLVRRAVPLLFRMGLPTTPIVSVVTGTDHALGEFTPAAQRTR